MKKINRILYALPTIFLLFGCSKKKVYERSEDTIYFGSYPQSLVSEADTLNTLNSKISNLPSENNLCGWTDYNYYNYFEMESYMYYIDIDLDNDNINDYRGVYFTKYRPNHTAQETDDVNSFQIRNGYEKNKVYWFKYEPIKWTILETKGSKARITTDLCIDSREYNHEIWADKEYHNGGLGYSNNYELSDIRKWLNDNFYNSAFSISEKKIIREELVDNSDKQADTLGSKFVCDDTIDNVTILSFKEVEKYYKTLEERTTTSTEYAKCQGADCYYETSPWNLRTPISLSAGSYCYVGYDGNLLFTHIVDVTIGVRPVIWINL